MGGGWSRFMVIWKVYMGLCGQGSRGRGISAIGGWQWGRGSRAVFTGGRLFAGTTERGMGPRPRCHGGRISTRGQGGEGLRDSSTPLRCAWYDMTGGRWVPVPVFTGAGSSREQWREGWVPASARTTRGRGRVPVPVCTGGRLCAGTMREGWVPASARTTEGKGNKIPGLRFAALGMT